jgi:hypothetical protein
MQIAGREKLEYIMSKTQPPQDTDAGYSRLQKIKKLKDGC